MCCVLVALRFPKPVMGNHHSRQQSRPCAQYSKSLRAIFSVFQLLSVCPSCMYEKCAIVKARRSTLLNIFTKEGFIASSKIMP